MRINTMVILVSALFLVLVCSSMAFSKERDIVAGPPIPGINSEPEMQWVWGEVIWADPIKKEIVLKYLDYETDTEKQINILVDAETLYSNLSSLDKLKPQDSVSIDYIVDFITGANIARNISIENPQELQDMPFSEDGAIIAPDYEMPPNIYEPGMQMPPPGTEQMPPPPEAEQKSD